MKKLTACILLGLALSVSSVAHADTNSRQSTAQKSRNKYLKQQKRSQKKTQKAQKKAAKALKKQHNMGH